MNKRIIFMVFLFSAFSEIYAADNIDKEGLTTCQSETNSDRRLACYDKIMPPAATAHNKTAEGAGKWQIDSELSPVDDSKNVTLSLSANQPIRSQFGETVTPGLYVICRENKTELFINWSVYLGMGDTEVLYRLDKAKAQTNSWGISADNKAAFYRGNTIELAKELATSTRLFLQVTPYGENTVSATFDLAGLPQAIKPLQEACGWK